ncbi:MULTISPECIES: monofunctional biosynthetic peptidoglycan transglycosylase [Ignavibacterium]|jgi:monofunctional biosynthetic peptidoglycan transglycosylase|uniref:monofunctional biosynthetic peptidoglycan transglycosylase n=1 Tax=Ignavibacterium TaxID=795750 RepID=UPI0025BE5443|nr:MULTISPECIES: monofunctional biosynthetic peptidoglycan transglycosylase [Ignavibacterium]MBI5662189.1 monofunctional biosynthetic peptidoglycan transglycosylase [Ignavibacterium album]
MAGKNQTFGKRFLLIIKAVFKFLLLMFLSSVIIVFLLRWINPITSSVMVQRQIQSIFNGDFDYIKYSWIDYDNCSPYLPIAFVAAEDQNFPEHFGFDVREIKKALKQYERGRRIRGASTITQQVAKNLFLWEGKSFIRKGIEAYFTVLIELLWDKKRILEVYMNIAEFGDMIFGVKMASLAYYKKLPAKVSPAQAALLAAVLPNPRRYSVLKPSGYVRGRQNWILKQMNSLGGPDYLKEL